MGSKSRGSSKTAPEVHDLADDDDAIQFSAEAESRQPSLALSVRAREGSMVLAKTPSMALSVRDGSMALSEKVDDEPGIRTDRRFR